MKKNVLSVDYSSMCINMHHRVRFGRGFRFFQLFCQFFESRGPNKIYFQVKRRVIEKVVAHPTSNQLAFAGDSGSEENSDEEDSSEAANESPILVQVRQDQQNAWRVHLNFNSHFIVFIHCTRRRPQTGAENTYFVSQITAIESNFLPILHAYRHIRYNAIY